LLPPRLTEKLKLVHTKPGAHRRVGPASGQACGNTSVVALSTHPLRVLRRFLALGIHAGVSRHGASMAEGAPELGR
jgi:hypothetical protein